MAITHTPAPEVRVGDIIGDDQTRRVTKVQVLTANTAITSVPVEGVGATIQQVFGNWQRVPITRDSVTPGA